MITLSNETLEVEILEQGVTIVSFKHKKDNINITTRYQDIASYKDNPLYLGALIGPLAGRTAPDRYGYVLDINDPPNQLHGGTKGLHSQIFNVLKVSSSQAIFTLTKDDVDYEIKTSLEDNTLLIDMKATPQSPTRINLTNHMYFNLLGENSLENHFVTLKADKVSLHNASMQNDGNLITVKDTAFDLNQKTNISTLLKRDHDQFHMTRHIDHSYKAQSVTLETDHKSLTVEGTSPYMHLYFGNFFDEAHRDEHGRLIKNHASVAIESQYVPNDIDMPEYDAKHPYHESIRYTLNID